MYRLPSIPNPKPQEFSTAKALSSTYLTDDTDDDFDFYTVEESTNQFQNDYLGWQSAAQEKKGKDGINTATEYDTWEKNERSSLSKGMNENQLSYFNRFADEQDSLHRPWAKKYEAEQRKTYAIDTQNATLTSNKASLAANLYDDNVVLNAYRQIVTASNKLARLQGLGEKERAQLEVENVDSAIKAALQGRIDADILEDAEELYIRHAHFLTDSSQKELRNNLYDLHLRTQARKTIAGASNMLLQMDEETAAAYLNGKAWLQSMNISEEMLPELKEYSSIQRQNALREEKQNKDTSDFKWFDKVITTNLKDPMTSLQLVQERKDLEPELRLAVMDAIQNGRINSYDSPATMFALQDRIFGDDPDVEKVEFAREIGMGNLKIDTYRELFEMQKNLSKGEKNLMRNALHILDSNFKGIEDFEHNPNRLTARNIYIKSFNQALTDNNTLHLMLLNNSTYVQALGQGFSIINALNQHTADAQNNPQGGSFLQRLANGLTSALSPSTAHASDTSADVSSNTTETSMHQNKLKESNIPAHNKMGAQTARVSTKEEGIILMERPLDGCEWLHNEDDGEYGWVRHEQFFPLKNSENNFGKFGDGSIRADDPKFRSRYVQKDMRVFNRKFIEQARIELEQEAKQKKNKEIVVNMDNPQRNYYLLNKNCLTYVNDIIRRAEALAKKAGESLIIK